MRDDNYLQGRLDYLWDRYFGDIEQKNDVVIRFGRRARTRLGSIKEIRDKKTEVKIHTINKNDSPIAYSLSLITINGLFRNPDIPEFLIDSVIAHEMVHYTHGFASPHDKKFATPHAGGIIKQEMKKRGLEDLFVLQKKWLKENWRGFADKNLPRKIRIRKKRRVFFIHR